MSEVETEFKEEAGLIERVMNFIGNWKNKKLREEGEKLSDPLWKDKKVDENEASEFQEFVTFVNKEMIAMKKVLERSAAYVKEKQKASDVKSADSISLREDLSKAIKVSDTILGRIIPSPNGDIIV